MYIMVHYLTIIYIHTYMYTYIHTYIYIYIYIYNQHYYYRILLQDSWGIL